MIVFASNFMNHHQLPLCTALRERLDDDFYFIATEHLPDERAKLGYDNLNELYWVVKAYESSEKSDYAEKLCRECDVLIIGSAPERYIQIRDKDKIVLRYSERPYKNYTKLKAFISEIIHHYKFLTHRNIYLLCASAFTAIDHAQFGMYKNKMYKWGYFPEVKEYDCVEELINKKLCNGLTILWVGRFISWKHPQLAIRVAEKLSELNINIKLKMVGIGELYEETKQYIDERSLSNIVELKGAMTPQQVRVEMENASIFLFTSDRNEGWGAVLNEAMNSACAVVADSQIGSVPFLLTNEKNGLVYLNGNFDQLFNCVKRLISDDKFRISLQYSAYASITKEWSAQTAAERLAKLIICLNKGEETPFLTGPCSKAEIIKEPK